MSIRPVQGLLLSIMLIWTMQTIAQETQQLELHRDVDGLMPIQPITQETQHIELSDNVIGVNDATILRRLAWGAMLLIDSDERYKLVPLFGYPIAAIEDRLRDLSIEAAARDVRLAILTSEGDGTYTGQGVRISTSVSTNRDTGTGDERFVTWDDIRRDRPSAMVAFTRPLRGMVPEKQFVAGLNLWANWSDEPSDTSAPTDDGN